MMSSAVNLEENSLIQLNLETEITTSIIRHIDDIYSILARAAIPVRPYTRKALQALSIASEPKKLQILNDLKNWKAILIASDVGFDNIDERKLATKALSHFNFKLKNYDWLDVCQNQITEIYNQQGIQIYRSLNFFETCGYSLLDLCVNEWYVLWERPKWVLNHLHTMVNDVLSGRNPGGKVDCVGNHLIRETYDDGSTQPFMPRTAFVEFGSVYPAFSSDLRSDIAGLIITSHGKIVSEGNEATAINFI